MRLKWKLYIAFIAMHEKCVLLTRQLFNAAIISFSSDISPLDDHFSSAAVRNGTDGGCSGGGAVGVMIDAIGTAVAATETGGGSIDTAFVLRNVSNVCIDDGLFNILISFNGSREMLLISKLSLV